MKLAPASDRTETSRLFLTSVVLEPGEYMLRLAAADGSGAAGSVYHTITRGSRSSMATRCGSPT